jgi:hypothetical protein
MNCRRGRDAGVLLGHGLGVDLRHARRVEVLAHLREQRRHLSMRAVADFRRSGIGAKSRAIRLYSAPPARLLYSCGSHAQDCSVSSAKMSPRTWFFRQQQSTCFSRESDFCVDAIELAEQLLVEVDLRLAAGGRVVVERRIEAVVADLRRAHRIQAHPLVEPALGERVEFRVGLFGGGGRCGGAFRRCRGRLALAGGESGGEGRQRRSGCGASGKAGRDEGPSIRPARPSAWAC